jgi:hypothetical protein
MAQPVDYSGINMTNNKQQTDDENRAFVLSCLNADTVMDTAKLHANALANIHGDRVFGGSHVNQEYLTALLIEFGLDAAEGKQVKHEYMLGCQIATLDAIFVNMMVKIGNSNDVATIEGLARVALKAQDNMRKTILTLHEMKSPKAVNFIKQQNNQSLGHMQVNNAKADKPIDKAKNLPKIENELLEQSDGERLDFGTAQATSGANPVMATVG